jgi:hypothetical protein
MDCRCAGVNPASLLSDDLTPSSEAMRPVVLNLFYLSLLVAGCSGPGKASLRSPGLATSVTEPYVRIVSADSNRFELQIAARQFLPRRRSEPVVWLIGVSHIGESNYYARLQTHLDARTLVLFEGIGAAEDEKAAETAGIGAAGSGANPQPNENAGTRSSLQSAMAASLGLVFQLEAIDYRRPNFRNSDLSITQLRRLMAQAEVGSGQAGASEGFESLLELMEGNSWFDSLLQLALRFLGANPKLQALGRLALIELLGQIQGDPSQLQGMPPEMKQLLEVLLQRRNEKVIADLKLVLPRFGPTGSIGIFFGTGHMPDLEARLRRELKYRPAQQIWFTVFEVDLAASKISPSERAFIDNFVKWQLSEAGSTKHRANSE